MEDKFKEFFKSKLDSVYYQVILGVVFFLGLALFMLYQWLIVGLDIGFIAGVIGLVGFFYFRSKFKGELKGSAYWLDLLEKREGDIVWIKPITRKHTVGYVIPLYEEREFQLLTKEGYKILFKCHIEDERITFFEGVKLYLPDAHIGYSQEIDEVYDSYTYNFINELKARGLYKSVKSLV